MISRREFLKSCAVGISGTTLGGLACATQSVGNMSGIAARTTTTVADGGPPLIETAIRRDETILRFGGSGDGLTMTWSADDRQFVALQDGIGWGPNWLEKLPNQGSNYNSRLLAVVGGPRDATFEDVPGYPDLPNIRNTEDEQRYYGFGTLALNDRIYQFLSTLDHPVAAKRPCARWVGTKLIYSPDNGRTWHNQDGSTPVVWESWQRRSRDNMAFFKEPQEAFSLLTFLQMGRNYECNQDGYVYVYAPNGNTDGTMNELVMFRVPKARILERRAYQYFAGLTRDGGARWVSNIDARGIVHTFPRGWVNKMLPGALVVESWLPSVTYNKALGLYLMASCGVGCTANGEMFGKPSYLGFWVAHTPWGPWRQIFEETAWTPAGDENARALDVQIAPKWISADGKSFWLVWTDFGKSSNPDEGPEPEVEDTWSANLEEHKRLLERSREQHPGYAFTMQRVDLIVK